MNQANLTASIPTVEELIKRALRGEARACRHLYDRYSRAMYNTAYRLTGNAADAEDMLQEAFAAAFADLKKFNRQATFGAWLKKIVVYKSIGLLRKRKWNLVPLDEQEEEPAAETETDASDIELTVEKIRRGILQLPDGYRAVLSLHLLEGYDYDEISDILSLAPVTVRSQFMRGKQKLLSFIQNDRLL